LLLDRISQYEDSDSSDSEKSVELSSDATSESDGKLDMNLSKIILLLHMLTNVL